MWTERDSTKRVPGSRVESRPKGTCGGHQALLEPRVIRRRPASAQVEKASRSASSVDQNASSCHGISLGANARTSTASEVVRG